MEQTSTTDIDDVCNVIIIIIIIIQLYSVQQFYLVCFSILSASIKPKIKSKVFIISAKPIILAYTSDSCTTASASSHVASNFS